MSKMWLFTNFLLSYKMKKMFWISLKPKTDTYLMQTEVLESIRNVETSFKQWITVHGITSAVTRELQTKAKQDLSP
jgi:hypothetical protein